VPGIRIQRRRRSGSANTANTSAGAAATLDVTVKVSCRALVTASVSQRIPLAWRA
jgi:hypothetical protein